MAHFSSIRKFIIGLLVFGGALSACHRASYSFQRAKWVPEPVAAAGAAPATASASMAGPAGPAGRPASKSMAGRAPRKAAHWPARRRPTHGRVAPGGAPLSAAPMMTVGPRRALPPHRALAPEPAPAQPRKGVAVALAVLFGVFGAHLFYLRLPTRALQYLGATLLCALLIAVLLSMLPVSSLSSGFAILFLLCLGVIGIGLVYVHALLDALQILFGGLDAIG